MNYLYPENFILEPQSQRLINLHLSQNGNTAMFKKYKEINRQKFKNIKWCTIVILFVLYSLYRLLFPKIEVQCIMDLSFEVTKKLNEQLNNSNLFYNIWAVAQQEIIELNFVIIVFLHLFKHKQLKIGFFAVVFFSLRGAIFIRIAQLPFSKGIISYYPVVPVLTVPYGVTRDFYYSGHSGFLLLTMTELKLAGYNRLFKAYFLFSVIVIGFLISSRVHYIIDVIGAIIFAGHIYRFILPYVIYCDKLFSIPYEIGKFIYLKIKNKEITTQMEV